MEIKYIPAVGSRYSDQDAQVIGTRLSQVIEESGLFLTAQAVIDDARPEMSPLHPYFTWDDRLCGQHWRDYEARHMLRSIHVVIGEGEEARQVRAFHVVTRMSDDEIDTAAADAERGYYPIVRIMGDDRLMDQIIERALKELQGWQSRYRAYKQLAQAQIIIDQAIQTLQPQLEMPIAIAA
jgi:hypothetical protein